MPVPQTQSAPDTTAAALTGQVIDEPEAPCTPEYARELTDRAIAAAASFDSAILEIVRVRAWEALGYQDAREYLLAEFRDSKSRAQLYRMARLAIFMYGLEQRVGDDALALAITERSLRALPSGNDELVLDDIETRLADAEDLTAELTQQIVDDVLAEHAERSRARKDEQAAAQAEPEGWPGGGDGRLGRPQEASWDATLDPDAYMPDIDALVDDLPGLPDLAPVGLDLAANPAASAGGDGFAQAEQYASLVHGLREVAAAASALPDLLDAADREELAELLELAETCAAAAAAVRSEVTGLLG